MRVGIISWYLFQAKGGAERSSAKIAHAMIQRGHECCFFYQGNVLGAPAYHLPENVPAYHLDLKDKATLEQARQIIRKADIDVVYCRNTGKWGLWLPALLQGSGIPLLVAESVCPDAAESFYLNREERLAYMASADGIHLLSQSSSASLPEFMQKSITVIPNPAASAVVVNKNKEASPRKMLLAVARLHDHQKQLALLIRAFAALADDYPEWDCIICGAGPSHGSYTRMITDMRLEHRIKLVGLVDDVESYLRDAHLFCLPSLYEGCPNALLEAQTYGLPSVGFAACSGVNEIIIHGENGILAQDMTVESLAAALRPLMTNADMRHAMGKRAHELLYRYDEKTILDQWEAMFQRVWQAKHRTRLDSLRPVEDESIEKKLREILRNPRSGKKYTSAMASKVRGIHMLKIKK